MHPNAYLKKIKNVRAGLSARSRILFVLDRQGFAASNIAKQSFLSYAVVIYHLRLLKDEGIVQRKGSRPYVWLATGLGQRRLG